MIYVSFLKEVFLLSKPLERPLKLAKTDVAEILAGSGSGKITKLFKESGHYNKWELK